MHRGAFDGVAADRAVRDVILRATAQGSNVTVETAVVTVENLNYDCAELQ